MFFLFAEVVKRFVLSIEERDPTVSCLFMAGMITLSKGGRLSESFYHANAFNEILQQSGIPTGSHNPVDIRIP